MQEEQAKFKGFAIVELMGRQVIAGYISEQVIAGAAMQRVDMPSTECSFRRSVEPWIVPVARPERSLVDSHGREVGELPKTKALGFTGHIYNGFTVEIKRTFSA